MFPYRPLVVKQWVSDTVIRLTLFARGYTYYPPTTSHHPQRLHAHHLTLPRTARCAQIHPSPPLPPHPQRVQNSTHFSEQPNYNTVNFLPGNNRVPTSVMKPTKKIMDHISNSQSRRPCLFPLIIRVRLRPFRAALSFRGQNTRS